MGIEGAFPDITLTASRSRIGSSINCSWGGGGTSGGRVSKGADVGNLTAPVPPEEAYREG